MDETKKERSAKIRLNVFEYAEGIFGMIVYAVAFRTFMSPLNLFSGGILGLSQVIYRTLTDVLHLNIPFDISGILLYISNIPLLILAYKTLRRSFIVKTIIDSTVLSVLLSVIKIPAESAPLADDPLASCILGGLLCGFGIGIALRSGGSSGGLDILGMYLSQKKQDFSIGKVSVAVNSVTYTVAVLLTGDIKVAIYSLIYAVGDALTSDRFHSQNIKCEVMIFTKREDGELEKTIMEELVRGVTFWEGKGAYTGEPCHCLIVISSKYEIHKLKAIVKRIDPHAFIIIHDKVDVPAAFQKRL